MYVQWLLEFVWRIFIQGPLLFIDFLTGDNLKSGSLFTFNVNLVNSNHFINYLSFPIFMGISLIVLFICFCLRIAYITIKANGHTSKYEIIKSFKKLMMFSSLILFISLLVPVILWLMDQLNLGINKVLQPNYHEVFINHPNANLSDYVYLTMMRNALASHDGPDLWTDVAAAHKHHFFYPEHFSIISSNAPGNKVNFFVSIIFSLSVLWFLLWMVWNVFQKILEVFFLCYSLAFAMSFSFNETNDLRWKIWIREIVNKILIFILLIVMYRIFVYMYVDAYHIIAYGQKPKISLDQITKPNNFINPQINILYIMFIVVLAIGSTIMFLARFISHKNFEYIGIWSSIKSFQQTRDFINNYKNIEYLNLNWNHQSLTVEEGLSDINNNINYFRESLVNSIENKQTFNAIERVKVFNR